MPHQTTHATHPIPGRDDALTALYRRLMAAYRTPRTRAPLAVVGAGLAVRPSTIGPHAGRGLFATRPFARGELITGMDGEVFGGPAAAPSVAGGAGGAVPRWSHFRVLLRGALWIDGRSDDPAPPGVGGASYANDAAPNRGPAANNAVFAVLTDRRVPALPLIALRARRPIARGEEIFVGYGRGYWRRFEAHWSR